LIPARKKKIKVISPLTIIFSRLEKDMKPTSESTALEGKHQHHEYLAAGKLKGNKALITGGE
jgi:hypothetical protein